MDSNVTVRFGADTSELDTGANQAETIVTGLDARLAKLDKTLVRLSGSIKSAFGQPVGAGQVADTERLIAALGKLEAKLTSISVKSAARRNSQRQNVVSNKAEGASLDELGQKAERAQRKMNPNGMGAKPGFMGLRPFELQNLSFQVNDFFTQIASGSSVMQASFQQSGQVFQIFQRQVLGLARFLPAVGAAIVGVSLAIGGLMTLQTNTAMLREFNAELSLSADGALYNAAAVAESARQLDLYGGSLGDARKNMSLFIKEGVLPDKLEEFGRAAQDLSEVMKIELTDAAKEVSKAFTGNYDDVRELDDAVNFLTATERDHIRSMFESGDAQGARAEAFRIFNGVVNESAEIMRGPAHDAAMALEGAWTALMTRIANSSMITNTMNELAALIGVVERALELTGTGASSSRGSFGSSFRSPEVKSRPLPWWMGGGTPSIRRPEWTTAEFWRGRPLPQARAGALSGLLPEGSRASPTLQQSVAGAPGPVAQQSRIPEGATAAQLKAESDLTLEYQRQAEAAGGLTTQQRLLRAEREGLARAAGLGLSNEGALRIAAAARAAEQEKIDAEAARKGASAGNRARAAREREAREAYRAAQETLRNRLEAIDTEQAAAEDDFQKQLELQDQKLAALKEFYGESSREYQSAVQQRLRIDRQYQEQKDRLDSQRRAAEEEIAQIGVQAELDAAREALALEEDLVQRQLSAAQISAEAGITALAEIKQREIELERKTAERIFAIRMASLRAQLDAQSLSVTERDAINRRIEVLEAQHQAVMAGLARQQSTAATTAVRDTTETIRTQWEGRVQPIGSALANLFTGAATGTQTLMMGLQGVGQAILGQVNEWVAKQVTAWLTAEAVKTAAAVTGETARTGATAVGVTTRTGLEVAGAAASTAAEGSFTIASIGMAAVRAAAGAYAAIAGIPVIGPILAPVMAATALAAVLALGSKIFSAQGGWGEVPHDGATTILHKKEMVLPAQFAVPLRAALKSGRLTASQPVGTVSAGVSRGLQGASRDAGADVGRGRDAGGPLVIQAMDAESFMRFVFKHRGALGNAARGLRRDFGDS